MLPALLASAMCSWLSTADSFLSELSRKTSDGGPHLITLSGCCELILVTSPPGEVTVKQLRNASSTESAASAESLTKCAWDISRNPTCDKEKRPPAMGSSATPSLGPALVWLRCHYYCGVSFYMNYSYTHSIVRVWYCMECICRLFSLLRK